MKPILGTENPQIKYVRYESPSAFRKAGAFLPREVTGIYDYRLSPYMGCAKRCQYCFVFYVSARTTATSSVSNQVQSLILSVSTEGTFSILERP